MLKKQFFSKKTLATMLSVVLLCLSVSVSGSDFLPVKSNTLSVTADATSAALVKGGEWVPVDGLVNAWYYVTKDGVHHSDCFAFDGYYVEASGVRFLTKKILDVELPMRNTWLTASAAGNFDCFVTGATLLQNQLRTVLGKYRTLTVYNDNIRLTSIVEENKTTYVVDRLSLYKNSTTNGYSIVVATSLGGDRKTLTRAAGDVDLIAYYDYEVLRFFTNSISRNGDKLAAAIYSHWQDANEQSLKFGQWVNIGDTMVRYMPSNGQGIYEIRPIF